MALANYLDPEKVNAYEKAILAAGLPIVLDNGAFETGHPDGINNLFRKAGRLKAKYVFAPDHLFDAKKTRDSFEIHEYIKKQTHYTTPTAVVVQASNYEEYLDEFIKYNNDPRVAVIGLSYLAISHATHYPTEADVPIKTKSSTVNRTFRSSRWSASSEMQARKRAEKKALELFDVFKHTEYTKDRVEMLREIALLNLKVRKPVHILGLGESHDDLKEAVKEYPWCLYNDTSTCYMVAKNDSLLGNDLVVPGGKIREKINIEDTKKKETEEMFTINISQVRKHVV